MNLPRWSVLKQSKFAFLQVIDEAYNGAKLRSTDQAVLSDNGLDKSNGYSVPLEIKPSGQFEPLYRTKLDVQVSLCFHTITTPSIVINKMISLYVIILNSWFTFTLFFFVLPLMEGWGIANSSTICLWSCCYGA